MKWTGLNDLRESYLSFFESKGHLRLPSFSLVPKDDKSLLLINSGMAPMKKYFTGEITPPSKRITSCQKCIRTPDIERVGKTARHGTYFEMLGNFSFGDYFKEEATAWAWEYFTESLQLPVDRIWISIYEEDDEAFEIWTKKVGVSPDKIVRLGKEDNFWEHGSGPCGPCSELHFDRGEKYSCGSPDCAVGCECDRYVEVWNLVFTQFESDGKGKYTPLANPNIDTGLGLERLACVMQGVNNLFEVDTVQSIMKHASQIARVNYGDSEASDVSLRVITDHIRSTTFMIGDGVMPSNEGRGYVVRRLLRRAARHGRLLGINEPFLFKLCETVIEENKTAYPELSEKSSFIKKLIFVEEESFGKTIDSGLLLLDEMLKNLVGDTLTGEDAFLLYDTYGFPFDLTKDIIEEKGLLVDESAFNEKMKEQRERARSARKDAGADAWKSDDKILENFAATEFSGYTSIREQCEIIAIIKENEKVTQLAVGDSGALIFSKTPFYPEGGGQAGDKGVIFDNNSSFDVLSTAKSNNEVFLHVGKMTAGQLQVGDKVSLAVDKDARRETCRHHTSAHLLQAALRAVLGDHVEQAGQMVDQHRMRFDFSHFSALTPIELSKIESLINEWILDNLSVSTKEMSINDAKKAGAMALFGEKYGLFVRVVTVTGHNGEKISAELCGGTHINNTAEIALFKIISESSVAAGIRRIEAVAGRHILALINQKDELLKQTALTIKAGSIDDIPRRAVQIVGELKAVELELSTLLSKKASDKVGDVLDNTSDVLGFKVAVASFDNVGGGDLRIMMDSLKDKAPSNMIIVLGGSDDGKVALCCFCGVQAVKAGAHAGNIVREVAILCGGKGGGRPDFAMAGASDTSKINDALGSVEDIIKKLVN